MNFRFAFLLPAVAFLLLSAPLSHSALTLTGTQTRICGEWEVDWTVETGDWQNPTYHRYAASSSFDLQNVPEYSVRVKPFTAILGEFYSPTIGGSARVDPLGIRMGTDDLTYFAGYNYLWINASTTTTFIAHGKSMRLNLSRIDYSNFYGAAAFSAVLQDLVTGELLVDLHLGRKPFDESFDYSLPVRSGNPYALTLMAHGSTSLDVYFDQEFRASMTVPEGFGAAWSFLILLPLMARRIRSRVFLQSDMQRGPERPIPSDQNGLTLAPRRR